MNLSPVIRVMWPVVIVAHLALFGLLLQRRAWREYSAFLLYVGLAAGQGISLRALGHAHPLYGVAYYFWMAVQFVGTLGVAAQLCVIVFRKAAWYPRRPVQFFGGLVVAVAVLAGAWALAAPQSFFSLWDRSAWALLTAVFLTIELAAWWFGASAPPRACAIAAGFVLYCPVYLAQTVVYRMNYGHAQALSVIGMAAYLAAEGLWIFYWLRAEPNLEPERTARGASAFCKLYHNI